jgi:hypothetical protein
MQPRKPVRAAIYGTCHATALRRVLLGVPGFADQVELVPAAECMDITADEFGELIAGIPGLDMVIYQPIAADRRGSEFATARFVETATDRTALLTFGYYHFELYTPFIFPSLHGLPNPPTHCFDYLLAALIARGGSDAEIATGLLELEGLEPYAAAMIGAAIGQLRLREDRVLDGDRPIDIPITDRVEAAYRAVRLGHTFNHPTSAVFGWIANDVLARLELMFDLQLPSLPSSDADPLTEIQYFAPPFVRRAFDMSFADDATTVLDYQPMPLAAYIDSQRAFYESIPRETLTRALEAMAQPTARPWYGLLQSV